MKNLILSSRRARRLLLPLVPKVASLDLDGGFRLAVDARDMTGPSYYVMNDGAEAFYHYELKEKAEILAGLGTEHPVLLDIGANIGLISLFVKRALPHVEVHAFEPMPHLADCIRQSIEMNRLAGIEVHSVALSDQIGTAEFFVHRKNSGGHSLSQAEVGRDNVASSLKVPMQTLDSFMRTARTLTRVDVMKIDVQGFETQVLKGAVDTLKRHHPRLIIEVDVPALQGELDWFERFFQVAELPYQSWKLVGHATRYPLKSLAEALQNTKERQLNLVFF